VRRLEERSLVERFPCLLEAAEALGARHIKVTPDGDDRPWDRGHWAEKFAELASQAQDVGARLGIEFFPWSNFKTLHDGLQLVEDAGHEAGGVVIDTWHIARAHTPIADLATVPLHRIIGVELNDADEQVVGPLFEDTVHRRRYCGEGSFDLPAMITPLRARDGTDPGGSRSSRTNTGRSRPKRRSAGPPRAPARCSERAPHDAEAERSDGCRVSLRRHAKIVAPANAIVAGVPATIIRTTGFDASPR
jgi:hypothetical protein